MAPPNRPIQTRVRESILQAILGGSIRPGQRLSIPALADTLGVSPTPIREALNSLAGDGVLELFAGGIVIVPVMTRAQLEQWLWLRRVLESRLLERGLERKTPSDAAAIAAMTNSPAHNTLDPSLCIQIAAALIDRLAALAECSVLQSSLHRARLRCAAALTEGQRRAGAEAAIAFSVAVADALRSGADSEVLASHSRYLDLIDAATLSTMGGENSANRADSTQ